LRAGSAFVMDDMPVAEFYRKLFDGLGALGIDASINTRPFDLDDEHALDENIYHCVCDRECVRRYLRVLVQVDQIFKEFSGRFNGKTCTPPTTPSPCSASLPRELLPELSPAKLGPKR
jgi:hypothetical protein